jgi:hypothetical protein
LFGANKSVNGLGRSINSSKKYNNNHNNNNNNNNNNMDMSSSGANAPDEKSGMRSLGRFYFSASSAVGSKIKFAPTANKNKNLVAYMLMVPPASTSPRF